MPQNLTDVREPVNALYYGDGGTGKTTALASMANLGKVLLVNSESGIKAKALRQRGVEVENIEVFPGPGEELTFAGLEEQWLRIREELNEDPDAYAGVGWDSVTEIQQALKDTEVQGAVSRANKAGRDRSPWIVDQDNWRAVNEQCRQLIRKYRDLPCHFGLTALTRREQDNDGAVVYLPSVTPGLQNDLLGWMDVVCVTQVALVGDEQEEEFRGLFRPHSKWRGKDRLNALPKWLVDPTFDRVASYVDDELDVEGDPVMQEARKRAEAQAKADKSTETKEK